MKCPKCNHVFVNQKASKAQKLVSSKLTPEQRKLRARQGGLATSRKYTPEERVLKAKKVRQAGIEKAAKNKKIEITWIDKSAKNK